jgi:hypothetical protein
MSTKTKTKATAVLAKKPLSFEEIEQRVGRPLLNPELRTDPELRKTIETMVANAIAIDDLKFENKKLFATFSCRALDLTPKNNQNALAKSLILQGLEMGYLTKTEVGVAMAKVAAEQNENSTHSR